MTGYVSMVGSTGALHPSAIRRLQGGAALRLTMAVTRLTP
jgi:hypothetical protein